MVMLKFGGGDMGGVSGREVQWLAAGVSYLCQGSGCSGVSSCMRRHSTSEPLHSLFLIVSLSPFCYPLTSFLLFRSHPLSTLLVIPFLCVAAPSSLKAERKEGKRESEGEREHESGGGGLTMGQIGSQLSVRPFITYLWLCAHLHCRAHIQN